MRVKINDKLSILVVKMADKYSELCPCVVIVNLSNLTVGFATVLVYMYVWASISVINCRFW